jgi:hypothetical protein
VRERCKSHSFSNRVVRCTSGAPKYGLRAGSTGMICMNKDPEMGLLSEPERMEQSPELEPRAVARRSRKTVAH